MNSHTSHTMDAEMTHKRAAILFYGLTKNLSQTVDSIQRNLFDPLTRNNIQYDIFVHTYKIQGEYHNQWSEEHTDNYINADVETLLQPKHYIYDIQDDIVNSIDFGEYYTNLGSWSHDFSEELTKYLIRNMVLALYSKKRITQLFETCREEYDYAIVVRPDLMFQNEIDVCEHLNILTDTNIVIPQKYWHAGVNDRFCIGKPEVVLYYGTLFDQLKEYSRHKSIISERFLLDKLNERGVEIIGRNIDCELYRINGTCPNK